MPHDYVAARAAARARAAAPPRIILYIKYARKSSLSSDQQALSIPTQLEHIDATFPDLPTDDEPVTESKSAFRPGRKKFNRIIERIEAGEITGIIAWHPNRLARNATDAGTIIRLILEGKLDLKFVTYHFEKTPEGLMLLQNMLSHGQYESGKLARDVRRGTDKKVKQGWYPGSVPVGYDTDGLKTRKGDRTVIVDKKRLPIVERAMRYALTGNYTVSELHRLMAHDWGLTTRKRKKLGGKPIDYQTVWSMFRNVFYAGYFIWDGELVEGKHKAIITLQQYERLQEILRKQKRGEARRLVRRVHIRFSGLFSCGPCGHMVSATEKQKHYIKTNRDAVYVYYHCARHSQRSCLEPHISEAKLIEATLKAFSAYRMPTEVRDHGFDLLIQYYSDRRLDRIAENEGHRQELATMEGKARNLTELRAAGEIEKEDFARLYASYKKRIETLRNLLGNAEEADWAKLVTTIKAIHFANNLHDTFENADGPTQRRLLIELADRLVLEHGKVLIKAKKWLAPLSEGYNLRDATYEHDRTSIFGFANEKTKALAYALSTWCTRIDAVAYLVGEELEAGRTVHADVKLPEELQARLQALRPTDADGVPS